jgi:hydroxyacylglutathione hydrolase
MEDIKYEVVETGKGSWRIEDNGVRAFLFAGTERALLVDTGFGTGDIKKVVQGLTRLPLMLVNTHADRDHIGCNALFEKAYMHPAEYAYYYESAEMNDAVSPLWDGDVIELGARRFEVVLIPGHTPGSIALLDRVNRLLVAGDSVSQAPIFMFGRMRNLCAHMSSMRKLLELRDGFDTVYPSHGPIPVGPDMIEKLIAGAERILNGEVRGTAPPFEMPAKRYVSGGASFFL